MATIVNNPQPSHERVIESDSTGWAVAVIVLVFIVAGGWYWYTNSRSVNDQNTQQPGATVNVTLPGGDTSGGTNPPANTSGGTPAPQR